MNCRGWDSLKWDRYFPFLVFASSVSLYDACERIIMVFEVWSLNQSNDTGSSCRDLDCGVILLLQAHCQHVRRETHTHTHTHTHVTNTLTFRLCVPCQCRDESGRSGINLFCHSRLYLLTLVQYFYSNVSQWSLISLKLSSVLHYLYCLWYHCPGLMKVMQIPVEAMKPGAGTFNRWVEKRADV